MTPEERAQKIIVGLRATHSHNEGLVADIIRETEAAARADERAELIRISGNWAIDPEMTDAEHDIISAFQDEIWRRARSQGQSEAAVE